MSYEEGALLERFRVPEGKERKSGLFNREADASLAVRACSGGIVLTSENRQKCGPLKKAISMGGKVVNLAEFQPDKISLSDFIVRAIS